MLPPGVETNAPHVSKQFTALFRSEHHGRISIPEARANNPEALWKLLVAFSLLAYNQANHYDRFRVSAASPAFDGHGVFKILSGANYRPSPTQTTRVCAERAMLDSAQEDDLVGGIVLVRGPEKMKPINGCREMSSLHSCESCRPELAAIAPDITVVTLRGTDSKPIEAFTVQQLIDYHDLGGEYPEMPAGATAEEVAMEALSKYVYHPVIPVL